MHIRIQKPLRALRFAEYCLAIVGCVLLTYYVTIETRSGLYPRDQTRQFDIARAATPASTKREIPTIGAGVIGRLQIPRIGLAAMVLEGSDRRTLELGIGHLEGTVSPLETGNVVLCGHRDTFFRELQHIRRGDTIIFSRLDASRTYRVNSAMVIDPGQTDVLDSSTRSVLTLITCYPFHYVGPAPKRFVVRATPLPETNTSSGAEQTSDERIRPEDEV